MEKNKLEEFNIDEKFVDVAGDPIEVDNLEYFIGRVQHYLRKNPEDLVVHFKKKKDSQGEYYAVTYIPVDCFNETC